MCKGAFGGIVPVAAPYAYARPVAYSSPYAVARPAFAHHVAAPLVGAVAKVAAPVEEYDPNPQYSFAYDIQDALTGKYYEILSFNLLFKDDIRYFSIPLIHTRI